MTDADYRQHAAWLIRSVIARPSMYYDELRELEAMMHGHSVAFEKLRGVRRVEWFNYRFAEWLYETRRQSGAAGWAHSVKALAARAESDERETFTAFVEEFLATWADG